MARKTRLDLLPGIRLPKKVRRHKNKIGPSSVVIPLVLLLVFFFFQRGIPIQSFFS